MATYTCYQGSNADLVKEVAELYLKPGYKICDPTWGKGVFWRKVDTAQYDLQASDMITVPDRKWDCRKLPYEDASFDVSVLDLPYAHNPGSMIVDKSYQNAATTKGMYHKDILDMYVGGMTEARRILRPGGQLWVKTQDEIESSFQRWSHIELYLEAVALGFFGKDMFVLMQQNHPTIQHKVQKHARKNHSYLWIFQIPTKTETTQLKRHNIFV